jgi:hypothetical protein
LNRFAKKFTFRAARFFHKHQTHFDKIRLILGNLGSTNFFLGKEIKMRLCVCLFSAFFLFSLAIISPAAAQTIEKVNSGNVARINTGGNTGDDKNKDEKTTPSPEVGDPLIRLLMSKGLISQSEGKMVSTGTPAEQRDKLANLLLGKGLITAAELETIRGATPPTSSVAMNNGAQNVSSIPVSNTPGNSAKNGSNTVVPQAPTVIPAIAPLRVLQLEGAKREGLIPDIKLGSGARLKLYGFFKTSVIYDTSSPGGNDFPLPGFLGDTGPSGSPEFHIKARSFRLGANFEWLDIAPSLTLTGRLEFDFEGDFTRAVNRNISSIRSSQPSIRLAWVRIDKTFNDKLSAHFLFGQDWTPFGSSTVPNTIETTGFHLGFGNIYERAPQVRTGVNFLLSKNRNVRLQPEIAFVLPFFGNTPSDVGNQLGFGERQGPDSSRPEIQGRVVLQFQLDKAPGVVPAQLITSFTYGERQATVTRAALNGFTVPGPGGTVFLDRAFPNGVEVSSTRYGYTGEFQLPTRWFTLIGKYYAGADLRAYFGGQLFSIYNDTGGFTNVVTVPTIDGSSTVSIGYQNGVLTPAPQRGVRGQGGFINLGLPLSRLFHADPKGRNAGWTAYLHYGYDEANPRDVRRFIGSTLNPIGQIVNQAGANRTKSDVIFGSLQYKLNAFVTFAYEQSYFRTRAANQAGALPLFRGIPSRETHNLRSELATIFTF